MKLSKTNLNKLLSFVVYINYANYCSNAQKEKLYYCWFHISFIPGWITINTLENTVGTCSHTVLRSGTVPDGFHRHRISHPKNAITCKLQPLFHLSTFSLGLLDRYCIHVFSSANRLPVNSSITLVPCFESVLMNKRHVEIIRESGIRVNVSSKV